MKLKNKIFLTSSITILGLVFFSGKIILEKLSIINEMTCIQELSDHSVLLSSLVHELQQERGASAGYLASKGKQLKILLLAQRVNTDRKMRDFRKMQMNFAICGKDKREQRNKSIQEVLGYLVKITGKRKAIDSFDISSKEAIKYYSDINSTLLHTIFFTSKITTDSKIAVSLSSYTNLLLAKENAGLERAVLSSIFARNRFTNDDLTEVLSLISAQNVHLKLFLSSASLEEKNFYKKTVQGKFVNEVQRLRNAAIKITSRSSLGIEPLYWFKMATGRINLLKKVEERISADMQSHALELKKRARLDFKLYIAIICIIILVAFFLPYFITLGITTPVVIDKAIDHKLTIAEPKAGVSQRSRYESPFRFLLIVTVAIFVSEWIAMFIISLLPPLSGMVEALLDSTLLIIMVSPVIYFFIFKPMLDNITRLRKSEEDIRKLSQAVMQSPASVIITDIQGNIEYVNPKYTQLTGYTFEEVIGKNPRFLKSGKTSQMEYKELWDTITKGGTWQGEFHNRKKNEELYWELASISPIRNDMGEITHFLAVKEDITEKKQAEEELIIAKETAEKANQAKSDFLANISHEIRTPMNGVIGMTELALATDLSNEQKQYLEMVKSSACSLMTLLNDILDFSKIEAGKLDIVPIDFYLRDNLNNTIKGFGSEAFQKDIEMTSHIDPEIPEILIGDPGRLRQIIINILSNALKFTDQGKITISVKIEPGQTREKITLKFSVEDTGIGIPEEKHSEIFQPFIQADSSVTRKYGGTGLGLSISRKLIEMMNGKFWVESQVEKGSIFHFTADFGLPKKVEKSQPALGENLQDLSVLIVDDHVTNRQVFTGMLENFKMAPVNVKNGHEALKEIEQARTKGKYYKLILIDVHMPLMDGYELVSRIKKISGYRDVKIIIITSAGHRGDAKRSLNVGASAYLTKPVQQAELIEAIIAAFASLRPEDNKPQLITRHSLRENKQKGKILLVEDNPVNQKLASIILEKQGYAVILAENGEKALQALDKENFDCILMDVQMPRMDGYEATVLIREKEKKTGAHIPIIAMTAGAMQEDREKCYEAGMDNYLAKPIRASELYKIIETELAKLENP